MIQRRPENLSPHPEGGRYREVYRSAQPVTVPEGASRSALTHIYFQLEPGEFSRFHRVASDEVWNLYRGAVRLHLWKGTAIESVELSAQGNCFCTVVPAGVWQAAEPLGGPVLVGCSVAPGFEFEDFEMIDPAGREARRLLEVAPGLRRLVEEPSSSD